VIANFFSNKNSNFGFLLVSDSLKAYPIRELEFRDCKTFAGGDRIKIYSLKSRGGIWLSHAQPNQRLNSLMTTAKTIESYFQKLENRI